MPMLSVRKRWGELRGGFPQGFFFRGVSDYSAKTSGLGVFLGCGECTPFWF